ncbi:MAG TPA: SusC/RagA family TonB-linked outer membrane protein, partial [Puia sp.]
MRLTIFLLITGLMHSQAAVYSQGRFTIHEKNITLGKVLKEIESSSDYSFFYRMDQIDLRQKVDIAVRDGDIGLVLKQALKRQSLSYDIVGKIVVIKPTTDHSSIKPIPIRGVIMDSVTHQPLGGVSVMVRGSRKGTTTNEKGEFTLPVSDSAVLIITFVGYQPLEMPVDASGSMQIFLRPANKGLNEVVVVGYGTQKRSNITGAVAQVDSKMLEDRPVGNVGQALQGVIANLNINFADGHPGSPAKLNIRGFTSLNGGAPLVIIDGVPGDINLLNPSDVETISVLKDASSAAIYGGRAAYGVILITTKHGGKGKVQVNYTGNYSVAAPTTSHEFMTDGYSTGKLVDEAFKIATGNIYTGYTDADYDQLKQRQTNHSLPDVVTDSRNGRLQYVWYGHTDWWHFFMRNTMPSMSHAVRFSGGTDNMDYAISGRYYQQEGLMQFNRDKYTNYNVRAKVNAKMTSWLHLSENMQLTANTYNFPGWGINNTFVSMGVHALPSYVPTNPDGTFAYRTNLNNYGIGDGLAADLQYGKSKGQQQNFDLTNIVTITADITKDISLVGSYSYDLNPYSAFQRRAQAPWSIFVGQTDYVGTDSYNESVNLDQYHVINAYANY